jgi:glycosyltransferase involved in cell wall biosynthesis
VARVALVTELYPPHLGGQEFRFQQFAAALRASGVQVTVYTTDHTGGSLPAEEVVQGVPVVRYVADGTYVAPGRRRPPALARYLLATRKLIQRLSGEVDAIVLNQMPIVHLLVPPYPTSLRVDWCEYNRSSLFGVASRAATHLRRQGIAIDESVRQAICHDEPRSQVQLVRTPLDLDAYAPGTPQPGQILYVGRLVPHKNLFNLADAVVAYRRTADPRAQLTLVGDGVLRSSLEQRYANEPAVRLLGRVDEARKLALLRDAWLLAIPSLREGFPNVVSEALAAGVPVLAIDVPSNGVAHFLREQGVGVLAEHFKSEAILRRLRALDEATWSRLRGRGAEVRQEFGFDLNRRRLLAALGCAR